MTQSDTITSLSAKDLSSAIHARNISCAEVMGSYLDRIEELNPRLNAIVALRKATELLTDARDADRALGRGDSTGWMHGIPQAVKDMEEVAGMPWTCGSRLFEGRIGKVDTPAVARVRAAGAIIIGKTNTPEFGYGSQTYNDVWGTTRNPYDQRLIVGGSSGGAAASIAARMLPVADGGDFMGSLRNPAAFNNVLGLRPTQGSFPETGSMGSLSTLGPIGRTVDDLALLLNTMVGRDVRSAVVPDSSLVRRPVRVGWLGDLDGHIALDPEVRELGSRALAVMREAGWDVVEYSIDFDWDRLWDAFLDLRAWFTYERNILNDGHFDPSLVKPETLWEIERSPSLTTAKLRAAYETRTAWWKTLDTQFAEFDLLSSPTTQVMPFDINTHWPDRIGDSVMDTYHRWMETVIPWTMSGRPTLNVPAGFDATGRPSGVQLVGTHWQESSLLAMADQYLHVEDLVNSRPPRFDSPQPSA